MENQHRHIKGYRELTPAEVELMNKVKSHERVLLELIAEVRKHLATQREAALQADIPELLRMDKAEPERWASIARTDFQTGFMALVRAVAQPGPAT
jgi:hypothetical protein